MQAEYEVYRKITATNRKMVMILPGTPLASIAVPASKKFLQLNHNEGNVLPLYFVGVIVDVHITDLTIQQLLFRPKVIFVRSDLCSQKTASPPPRKQKCEVFPEKQ
jgi:hypothetical protein